MISVLGAEKLSLVEIEAFLAASESVRFSGCGRTEIYGWVERLLCHHEYPLQKRRAKGLLRAYAERMTGFSRAQSTRLIGDYVKLGRIAPKPSLRPRFQRHYTSADIALLAAVDEAHESLSGPATHPSGQGPSAGDPGHAAYPQARVRGLRQARVRAAGSSLQRTPLQPAPQPALRPAPF